MAENESNIDQEENTGPREIKWSDQLIDLVSLENGSGLPHVIKFEDPSASAGTGSSLPTGIRMYSQQPILAHERTCKRHARARTIYHDKQGPYYEAGQTLKVPEDFNGWFEIVPPDFGRAQVCRTIGQIAEIKPRKFFTRTNIRAIHVDSEAEADDAEGQKFKEYKIRAGNVVTILGTFAGKWRTTASTGLLKSKSKEWSTIEVQYLKCEDVQGTEVLIPFNTQGRFSVVYEKGYKGTRAVFRMKDLMDDFSLPLKVRMVCGKAPVVPCIFTGMLILKQVVKEDCIISSTILNKRNVLFELPVSTKCNVVTARDEDDYTNMRTFIDAQMLCRKYAGAYGSLIKLSPENDTDQQMIQHIPTEKRKKRDESLKNLDLITNISTTDDEPRDFFMESSSDSDSIQSSEQAPFGIGQMMELREIVIPRTSQSISSA